MDGMRDLLRSGLGRALRDWQPLDRLVAAWPVAAGPALAAHGTPAHLSEGVLTVTVDDAVWLGRMVSLRETLARELSRIARVPLREIHFRGAAAERPTRSGTRHTHTSPRTGGPRP